MADVTYVGVWNVEGTTEESERFRRQEQTEVFVGFIVLIVAICYILAHA